MRLFQNAGIYPSYARRLNSLSKQCTTYSDHIAVFLEDRYGASHILEPILARDSSCFFANADHAASQRTWAHEQGWKRNATEEEILLGQIEHHRTEVFYNMDPMRFGSRFIRRLPASVKCSIAWRAAPSPGADFEAYSLVVCNFPSIIESYRQRGWRAAPFSPAHDPALDAYAANENRPIDVLFVGGYSRHHRRRVAVLEAVASLRGRLRVEFRLDRSRLTRLAESAVGRMMPISQHRRPDDICSVSAEPVFGRELYSLLSQAKIVLNGAVDMAGDDRGNMRCFEAMGSGALMVSDNGRYPAKMIDGVNMLAYKSPSEAVRLIINAISADGDRRLLAARGYAAIRTYYSKATQWAEFQRLVSEA